MDAIGDGQVGGGGDLTHLLQWGWSDNEAPCDPEWEWGLGSRGTAQLGPGSKGIHDKGIHDKGIFFLSLWGPLYCLV